MIFSGYNSNQTGNEDAVIPLINPKDAMLIHYIG